MPKARKNKKIVTPESDTLTRMRNAKGLSQAKTAKVIGYSKTSVNHYEAGWDDIPEGYIDIFIEKMGFTKQDWDDFFEKRTTVYDLKTECKTLVENMDVDKLKAVHGLLINFAS